jgi:hypothetical protein
VSTAVAESAERTSSGRKPHLQWWHEVGYILGFYAVYSFVRNQFGSAAVSPETAFANARRVMDVQEAVGLHFEERLQEVFLGTDWFLQAWNIFYGTLHFVVTAIALAYLFKTMPERYVRWRTTLACTTGLALIGFALFPLMPPRLLPHSYGYVDTLATYGGLWSFDSGAMEGISNQYAAMPSLHFAWSTWSMLVLLPAIRRPWLRALVLSYPVATVFAIIVTANHFWLDAVGGALALAVGYLMGVTWDRWRAARRLAAA